MNTQPPEGRSNEIGISLHSAFFTIQGEGPYAGHPAVFVRLAGCNLQCPGCDTEYTAARQTVLNGDVIGRVRALLPKYNRPLIVVTGGEPLRQPIGNLVAGLHKMGHVQIETNGTFNPPDNLPEEAFIVCSPKAGKVAPRLLPRIGAYKYVLDAQHVSDVDGLPTTILNGESNVAPARPHAGYAGRVFVSPLDVGPDGGHSGLSWEDLNQMNTIAAVESCMRHGYTLNLQIHKIVGLP